MRYACGRQDCCATSLALGVTLDLARRAGGWRAEWLASERPWVTLSTRTCCAMTSRHHLPWRHAYASTVHEACTSARATPSRLSKVDKADVDSEQLRGQRPDRSDAGHRSQRTQKVSRVGRKKHRTLVRAAERAFAHHRHQQFDSPARTSRQSRSRYVAASGSASSASSPRVDATRAACALPAQAARSGSSARA